MTARARQPEDSVEQLLWFLCADIVDLVRGQLMGRDKPGLEHSSLINPG